MFNFLDLLDLLTTAPQLVQKKIDDIYLILLNFHHFINEFRPHEVKPFNSENKRKKKEKKPQHFLSNQARETLKLTMESQVRSRQDAVDSILL